MKTKKLIQLLQEADPTGEEEVCVDNLDIFTVATEPAYWDGPLQILEREESNPYYNVTGAKYKKSGLKVVLSPLSITDAICNNTSLSVDYSELDERRKEAYQQAHNDLRIWYEDMKKRLEEDHFVRWFKDRALEITGDTEDAEAIAKAFFKEEGMDHDTPLPEGKVPFGKSYVDVRKEQWDSMFLVSIENGFLSLDKSWQC